MKLQRGAIYRFHLTQNVRVNIRRIPPIDIDDPEEWRVSSEPSPVGHFIEGRLDRQDGNWVTVRDTFVSCEELSGCGPSDGKMIINLDHVKAITRSA